MTKEEEKEMALDLKKYRKKLEDTGDFYEPIKQETMTFEEYLIMVGIRSVEYNYTDEELLHNMDHFVFCHKKGVSAYKALSFLYFHIEEKNNKADTK